MSFWSAHADVSELVGAYDEQLRAPEPVPRGVTVERDEPLLRFLGLAGRGFVGYRNLGGIEGADLDDLIARQVKVFAERGERFESKIHGDDRPADLAHRLRLAGDIDTRAAFGDWIGVERTPLPPWRLLVGSDLQSQTGGGGTWNP